MNSEKFIRNNICFRSAAAKALEGYYNSKAYLLNEVISSKNSCSETTKEVLLLLFNTYNNVLFFAETQLLDKSTVSLDDVESITKELVNKFERICVIFDQNIDIFDSNFIRHWMKIHKQLLFALYHNVKGILNLQPIIAFPMLTESLTDYLNATLFELHELDSLLGSNIVKKRITTNDSLPNGLILYMDDLSAVYGEATGVGPEMERFLYYVDTLIDPDAKFEVQVKDYSNRIEDSRGSNSNALVRQLKGYPQVIEVLTIEKGPK